MIESPCIVVYAQEAEELRAWLLAHGASGLIIPTRNRVAAESAIDSAEILLGWRFPTDLFASASRLRWVQAMGAGVEDLLSSPELSREVVVTRVTDQFGGPIAEYVFAELLARVRQIDRLRVMQREQTLIPYIPETLAGKMIGVAGLGSVGKEVVKKARAFDMMVYGLSRTGEAAAHVDRHFMPDSWHDFVRCLDVLVLTLPLTPATDRVVDLDLLRTMQPHALLVNVGRGRLVVEKDLVRALQEGTIGGAILDVFEREPLPVDSLLWHLPNVTVTPHIAAPNTVEGAGRFFLANLQRYVRGEPLVGVVDRSRGY